MLSEEEEAIMAEREYVDMPEKAPVVFMFRPTRYVRVETPEQLEEWRRLMAEKVGVQVQVGEERQRQRWVETVSVCNGPGYCDCDEEWV
jgi:hypothetical protein